MTGKFIHRPYQPHETIAAIATPPGEGGIAVIRISGTHALDIADRVFSRPVAPLRSHGVYRGHLQTLEGERVDEILLIPMHAPRSYTGEDTVELHCHGGSWITRRVLETVLKAGARPAQPGEFTLRAFLNGKMSLAQAEAVQEVIAAKNAYAMQIASSQLEGALSRRIEEFQRRLFEIAAILEAWVDFPEEGLEFASLEEVVEQLTALLREMERLDATYREGRIIHEGITLCLVGPPNAGKSSLLNALLRKERAIVTPIPGTTRDLLEEQAYLCGLHLRLVDTAGIRETEEVIEKEGIRRSREAMERADLILLVLDRSLSLDASSLHLVASLPKEKSLLVWNKNDLPPSLPPPPFALEEVSISALHGHGLEELKGAIERFLWKRPPPSKEEVVIGTVRHHHALQAAIAHLRTLIEGLQSGVSPEFLAADMRQVLTELGAILGIDITEEILSAVFSTFCVGK